MTATATSVNCIIGIEYLLIMIKSYIVEDKVDVPSECTIVKTTE
jgi:hypothetical protein